MRPAFSDAGRIADATGDRSATCRAKVKCAKRL